MSSEFPYLNAQERCVFPSVENASDEGVIAVGANLSPGVLLSAYSQGCFPWESEGDIVVWWNPDPRAVLYLDSLHISKRTQRRINSGQFSFKVDSQFQKVVRLCSIAGKRKSQGSWITTQFIDAYTKLYELGFAHSIEVYKEEVLVGGLYGVTHGSIFSGESMFSLVSDSSKVALVYLSKILREKGFSLIDCQVNNPHLASMGAVDISRSHFLSLVEKAREVGYKAQKWQEVSLLL